MSEDEELGITEGLTTLREYLSHLRSERDKGDMWTYTELGARALNRLILIERLFPAWLEISTNSILSRAITIWNTEKFAFLIGRAIVLPIDKIFQFYSTSPEKLLEVALEGLAPKAGRKRLSDEEQILIYDLWSKADIPQQLLAQMYQVNLSTIERTIRKWKVLLKETDM